MAKPNKTTEINEATLDPEIQAILDAALAGEGIKKDQVVEWYGLLPIYSPKLALENKWPALACKIDRIERLPTQRQGEKTEYTPTMLNVITTQATKAVQGTKDNPKIIDVPAGERLLLPVTGGLGVNRKLEAAASDPENVHGVIVIVTGTMDVGQPQDMFTFKVIPTGVKEKRVGVFAQPLNYRDFDGHLFESNSPAVPQMTAANGAPAQA